MVLALAALLGSLGAGCGEDERVETVTFDRTDRAVYGSQSDSSCAGLTTYGVDDVTAFSDVIAVGTVLRIDAALSPMKSNSSDVPNVSADDCDGTISAGIDARIRLDRVPYADGELSPGSTLTLRIAEEELDNVWGTMAVYEGGAIEWLGGQPLMEGDQVFFTAVALKEGVFSLSGHPFAWISGDKLNSPAEGEHGYSCLDLDYADELFRGSVDDSIRRIERLGCDQANCLNETGEALHDSRVMDAERGYYPDSARCFLDDVD